jgi:indolepyruvate decarboxylase
MRRHHPEADMPILGRVLLDALARAHATRGRFQLIEVMLPCGQTSDTLARFVAGFKAARERSAI